MEELSPWTFPLESRSRHKLRDRVLLIALEHGAQRQRGEMRDFAPASRPIPEGPRGQHPADREIAVIVEIKDLREDQILLDASFLQLDGHSLTREKNRQHPFLDAVLQHERMYSEADGVIRRFARQLVHLFLVEIQNPMNIRPSLQLEHDDRFK